MSHRKIALIGNPNTGKTSIFNHLTGLNQRVGNFPGVTVEKKNGHTTIPGGEVIEVIDLPGTYSIFPRSRDEQVVFQLLSQPSNEDYPELVLVVADASNLERNLLLFTQLQDLGLPLILVLTMADVALRKSFSIHIPSLKQRLHVPVVMVNGRTGEGIVELKETIAGYHRDRKSETQGADHLSELLANEQLQIQDTQKRYTKIREIIAEAKRDYPDIKTRSRTSAIDSILVHPVWGYAVFISILLIIFQAIFNFASIPMDWIDMGFNEISIWMQHALPAGPFTDLISQGIVPGIGGVVVFVPQILLLFLFLTLLEESGYMARVVFLMDKLVRPFGLNGKSVVPLMSSVACAIPGIMAARNISTWKDRIITIMVSPLMSCSARIPVYTLLIALVVPDKEVLGFFNLKGLVLFGLYSLGLVSALAVAWVMKLLLRESSRGYLLLELPTYQWPRWKSVFIVLWEKVRVFVWDAGKVIIAISVILWVLATYGPAESMQHAEDDIKATYTNTTSPQELDQKIAASKLEHSYIGILGRAIEPAIRPLGYDWKIGIALITSFAAREVFVGSMATIYSVGENFEEDHRLMDRLKEEKKADGSPVYTAATGISLMVFYVYAMQCMATLAVVKRETKTWKWPLIQVVYMGVLAYLASFVFYQILS